jgi:hypothetical protein
MMNGAIPRVLTGAVARATLYGISEHRVLNATSGDRGY